MKSGNEARKRLGKQKYTSKISYQRNFGLKMAALEVRAKLPKGRGTWPAIWMIVKI